MYLLGRLVRIVRYGVGPGARERKRAAKRRRKLERFGSERWAREGDFARREYRSYEDYLQHQSSKLEGIIDRLRENDERDFRDFQERFGSCKALAGMRTVLCLGARLGAEVRALHSLGHFAVGIDLNPGPDNPYVLPGDFHALVFPDASVDAVFTNALDHVFELERVVQEVRRLLRAGGVFVTEIEVGYAEGHVPGDFEAMHWSDSSALLERIRAAGGFQLEEVRELGETHRGRRRQAVFRKPGEAPR